MNTALAVAGLLVAAEQGGEGLVLRHDIGTHYNRTEYESACGSTIFRVRFRNGPEAHGRVDWLTVDGRPVRDAAATLQIRAARRVIVKIEIMNCGMDSHRPIFRGVLEMSEFESRNLGMRPSLYFRLVQQPEGSWRMILD